MNHLADERISQFGRMGVEATAQETTHLAECRPCAAQVEDARSMRSLFNALPLLAPSAAFARATVAAFEAAWQKKRARDVGRALAVGAALSVLTVSALLYIVPITAFNALARLIAQGTQSMRVVAHMAQSMTKLGASIPLLVVMVMVCFATTLLIERSVRLGRQET